MTYRICVRGHLDPLWSEWFSGMDLQHQPDGTIVLSSLVADQSALHGLPVLVRDLGLELVSVEQLPAGDRGEFHMPART